METKHLFIINPRSFLKQEALNKVISDIENYFAAMNNEDYAIRVSRFPRHSILIIDEYMQGADPKAKVRVYSIGGEGNNFCCFNGVLGILEDGRDAELALLPYGTTNDFALIFGKEHQAKLRDIALQTNAPVMYVDAIKCNNNYALNNCAVGLEAAAVINTAILNKTFEKYRRRFKFVMPIIYSISGIPCIFDKELFNQEYKITVDGEDLSGPYVSINIANGPYYGGGKKPSPYAEPDDGLLELVMLKRDKKLSTWRVMTLMHRYFKGAFKKYPELFVYRRCKKIALSSETPIYVNMDGEAFFESELSIEVIPQAVKLTAVDGFTFEEARKKRSLPK